jgi:hypothetical protein
MLSVLSSLADFDNGSRINKLFRKCNGINEHGFYAISLFKNGVSLTVVVDDMIPCKWSIPVFTKSNG